MLRTIYTEGFEGAAFGTFTTQSLDFNRASLAASDGHRCQYNDPDYVNSNSYGRTHGFTGTVGSGIRSRNLTVACSASWGTGSPAEVPGAGGDRDADLTLDPETCP